MSAAKTNKTRFLSLVLTVSVLAGATAFPVSAQTCTGTCEVTRFDLAREMDKHRRGGMGKDSFLFDTYWNDVVNPGLQTMLSKIVQTILNETTKRGTFNQAQNNVRGVSAVKEGSASAARDYAVSDTLCRFGSVSQSIGSDDLNARAVQLSLSSMGLDRNMGASGTASQSGAADDRTARMNEFIKEYCNPDENDNGLALMCGSDPQRRFENVERDTRLNRDIDFTRTIADQATLDFGQEQSELSPGQQDIIQLSNNLYGHKQLSRRPSKSELGTANGQRMYLKIRSVAAARSVAQNSYAAQAGMKSQGSGGSAAYINRLYQELGLSAKQTQDLMGERPSYYAQMDALTKKLYQNPGFYVNLMEGKTNVGRQSAAMEGLELMQDRDMYHAMRRSEMLLALLVQMQTRKTLGSAAQKAEAP